MGVFFRRSVRKRYVEKPGMMGAWAWLGQGKSTSVLIGIDQVVYRALDTQKLTAVAKN